jgi:hypothetical protein
MCLYETEGQNEEQILREAIRFSVGIDYSHCGPASCRYSVLKDMEGPSHSTVNHDNLRLILPAP